MNRSPVISLPDIILAAKPKAVVEDALIKLLTKRLKELGIVWNSIVFRKALNNPKLPARLLSKLEELIMVAEASGWNISDALKLEIDETVEDIEAYNPSFIARLKRTQTAGSAVTLAEMKRKLKIK